MHSFKRSLEFPISNCLPFRVLIAFRVCIIFRVLKAATLSGDKMWVKMPQTSSLEERERREKREVYQRATFVEQNGEKETRKRRAFCAHRSTSCVYTYIYIYINKQTL